MDMKTLERGEVVIAPDPHREEGRRPFAIVSGEEYPFHPSGHLGLPITTKDRPHTWQITDELTVREYDGLHVTPSYINPMSPSQVNEWGKSLLVLDNKLMDALALKVAEAMGIEP